MPSRTPRPKRAGTVARQYSHRDGKPGRSAGASASGKHIPNSSIALEANRAMRGMPETATGVREELRATPLPGKWDVPPPTRTPGRLSALRRKIQTPHEPPLQSRAVARERDDCADPPCRPRRVLHWYPLPMPIRCHRGAAQESVPCPRKSPLPASLGSTTAGRRNGSGSRIPQEVPSPSWPNFAAPHECTTPARSSARAKLLQWETETAAMAAGRSGLRRRPPGSEVRSPGGRSICGPHSVTEPSRPTASA